MEGVIIDSIAIEPKEIVFIKEDRKIDLLLLKEHLISNGFILILKNKRNENSINRLKDIIYMNKEIHMICRLRTVVYPGEINNSFCSCVFYYQLEIPYHSCTIDRYDWQLDLNYMKSVPESFKHVLEKITFIGYCKPKQFSKKWTYNTDFKVSLNDQYIDNQLQNIDDDVRLFVCLLCTMIQV
jgi:hypothetical protein